MSSVVVKPLGTVFQRAPIAVTGFHNWRKDLLRMTRRAIENAGALMSLKAPIWQKIKVFLVYPGCLFRRGVFFKLGDTAFQSFDTMHHRSKHPTPYVMIDLLKELAEIAPASKCEITHDFPREGIRHIYFLDEKGTLITRRIETKTPMETVK